MTRSPTRRRSFLGAVAAGVGLMAGGLPRVHVARAQQLRPVVIRLAADHSPPPHPAALAQEFFRRRLPEVIPGSELRVYHAGALYTIPEAVEAMAEGNLEMAWGQFGKTASVDRWMNVVAGPMLLTTPGAMEQLDNFETIKMLRQRFADLHGIEVLGTAHLSMFMGVGARQRLVSPEDFRGKKIRSMGPAENAMLEAWGASPVVMAFGDVPPAIQTGVIDGLLTSLGGFNVTRDQAPFYTVAGINGIVGDYYWVGVSRRWWGRLNEPTREALRKLIVEEVIPLSKQLNWCNDQRLLAQYRTEDPGRPGIYVLTEEERQRLAEALGDATTRWVKANTPRDAHKWVDRFIEEARAASQAHPLGSSWIEQTDCTTLAGHFQRS
ncbi:TRAP transporter substrate-binding protein [Crenalkalicoccus roseus]|uniref:TRAP transporter substrate-binding protein n=1 Tax=Crenalkalicoccus roseus TaxID=1485588 RepID=UPI00130533E2|nr:TRAP transporter substrate-binding protein DctP [Crenalkalicoccus roseus]